jgi:hypothetical protein
MAFEFGSELWMVWVMHVGIDGTWIGSWWSLVS